MLNRSVISKIFTALLIFVISGGFIGGAYAYFDSLEDQKSGLVTIGNWENCIQISTPQEFYNMATSSTSNSTDVFCLVSDIDFTGFTWDYIEAFDTNRFLGKLDGRGYALNNLKLTTSATTNILFSIFSSIEGATIENLVINNFGPDLTLSAFNNAELESAIFASEVYGIGNIIQNITINNSNVLGSSNVGGLITTVTGGSDITISNIKTNNITVANNGSNAGGLIGSLGNGAGNVIIDDIDFEGTIAAKLSTSTISNTGSLVGTVNAGTLTASRIISEYIAIASVTLNDGTVSYTSERNTGGFIGENKSVITINDAFYTGELYNVDSRVASVIANNKSNNVTLNNVFYSNVLFVTSYTPVVKKALVNGTVVNATSLPSVSWWNGFAVNFTNTNNLWQQDATGRLELIR